MAPIDLEAAARAAEAAADLARREILPRFRSVSVETKSDGSPVTEADRAAERVIRASLRTAFPDFAIEGEEYGEEGGLIPDRVAKSIDWHKHAWNCDP